MKVASFYRPVLVRSELNPSFTSAPARATPARFLALAATLLLDGRVLVVGGVIIGSVDPDARKDNVANGGTFDKTSGGGWACRAATLSWIEASSDRDRVRR